MRWNLPGIEWDKAVTQLCYFFGYTPAQVMELTFPQFFTLLEKLPEYLNKGGL